MDSSVFLNSFFNKFWQTNVYVHCTGKSALVGQLNETSTERIKPNIDQLLKIIDDLKLTMEVRQYILLDKDYLVGFVFDTAESSLKFENYIKTSTKKSFVAIEKNKTEIVSILINSFPIGFDQKLIQEQLSEVGQIVKCQYIQDEKLGRKLYSNNLRIELKLNENIESTDVPCSITIKNYSFMLFVKGLPPVCYRCMKRDHKAKNCLQGEGSNKKKIISFNHTGEQLESVQQNVVSSHTQESNLKKPTIFTQKTDKSADNSICKYKFLQRDEQKEHNVTLKKISHKTDSSITTAIMTATESHLEHNIDFTSESKHSKKINGNLKSSGKHTCIKSNVKGKSKNSSSVSKITEVVYPSSANNAEDLIYDTYKATISNSELLNDSKKNNKRSSKKKKCDTLKVDNVSDLVQEDHFGDCQDTDYDEWPESDDDFNETQYNEEALECQGLKSKRKTCLVPESGPHATDLKIDNTNSSDNFRTIIKKKKKYYIRVMRIPFIFGKDFFQHQLKDYATVLEFEWMSVREFGRMIETNNCIIKINLLDNIDINSIPSFIHFDGGNFILQVKGLPRVCSNCYVRGHLSKWCTSDRVPGERC